MGDTTAQHIARTRTRSFATIESREKAPPSAEPVVHPQLRAMSDVLFANREKMPEDVYLNLENALKGSHDAMTRQHS